MTEVVAPGEEGRGGGGGRSEKVDRYSKSIEQ